jgi:hypothetical protein
MTEQLTPEQVESEVAALEKKDSEEQSSLTGPVTEVTSLQQEEKKFPEQKFNITRQEFIVKVMEDYIAGMKQIQVLLRGLSKKAVPRIMLALLKIPEEGVKVNFQSDQEKAIFGLGQRILNARTTLILAHMHDQIDENKILKEEEERKKIEQALAETPTPTSDNKEIDNGHTDNSGTN